MVTEAVRAPGAGAHVLLVEDDPAFAHALADALADAGHRVRTVDGVAAARAALNESRPDLVVLDLVLPDGDGLVLCADLKAAGLPVLICSATRRRRDAVLGLRLGADDFVPKPCDLDELLARTGVLLRTRPSAGSAGDGPAAAVSPAPATRERRPGRAWDRPDVVGLSPAEARLLTALVERQGQAVGRPTLERTLGQPNDGYLAVLIWRLRTKLAALGPDAPRIETIPGTGYRLILPTA